MPKPPEDWQTAIEPAPGAVLLRNVECNSPGLDLGCGLRLLQVTDSNWETIREQFAGTRVYRQGQHWVLGFSPEWLLRLHDLFVLLRLFRPGNLCFEAVGIQNAGGGWGSVPHYTILSSLPRGYAKWKVSEEEAGRFSEFVRELQSGPGWDSAWFVVASRMFLLSSSVEFNLHWGTHEPWALIRPLGYMIALEAALVPESEFVGRRLRRRAPRLLGLDGEAASGMSTRLKAMYDIRSKLAHGSPLLEADRCALKANMPPFETDVRDILRAALLKVPKDEQERRGCLSGLYDVTDSERVQNLGSLANAIRCEDLRTRILAALNEAATEYGSDT